jgi:hypothetical protein
MAALRKWLLAGLLVIVPVAITVGGAASGSSTPSTRRC